MTGWLDYSKQSAYQPVIVLPDINHSEQHSHFLFHLLQQLQNYCKSRSQWAPTSEIVQIWKEAKCDYSVLIAAACSPTSPQWWHQDKIPRFCWSHWNDLDSDNSLQSHLSLLLPGYFHQGTDFFSLECAKLDATEWNFVFYPSSLFVGAKDHFARPTEECGTLPVNWSKYSNSDATHAFSLGLSLSHIHKLSIFLKNLI